VTVAPASRSTLSLMDPVPLGVQVAPGVDTHVHVAPVRPAGSVSFTVAPNAADGPAFEAVTV
jgi:hypothetical protein